jgi:hypothetical protein
MSEKPDNTTPPSVPQLPPAGLAVDYGTTRPGSSNPMPEERRELYQQRIRSVVKAQASGAKRAAKLFIR